MPLIRLVYLLSSTGLLASVSSCDVLGKGAENPLDLHVMESNGQRLHLLWHHVLHKWQQFRQNPGDFPVFFFAGKFKHSKLSFISWWANLILDTLWLNSKQIKTTTIFFIDHISVKKIMHIFFFVNGYKGTTRFRIRTTVGRSHLVTQSENNCKLETTRC